MLEPCTASRDNKCSESAGCRLPRCEIVLLLVLSGLWREGPSCATVVYQTKCVEVGQKRLDADTLGFWRQIIKDQTFSFGDCPR